MMDDRLEPRIRILLGSSIAIGPGKAALLEAIGDTGSIAAAGRRMGMSFRRACLLAKTMNACFREPLVDATKGGVGGGGARLSKMGREVFSAVSGNGGPCRDGGCPRDGKATQSDGRSAAGGLNAQPDMNKIPCRA